MEDEMHPIGLPCDNEYVPITETFKPIMADFTSYLNELRKLFPVPKRLEINETQPCIVTLYFQCGHTHYEYVRSTDAEWILWLKIGLTLLATEQGTVSVVSKMKARQIAPLDGENCIREYYEAMRSNTDEDYSVCSAQRMLSDSEQKQLADLCHSMKLYDVFAYDKDMNEWYFLHPLREGMTLDYEYSIAPLETKRNERFETPSLPTTTSLTSRALTDRSISDTKMHEYSTPSTKLTLKVTSAEDTYGDSSTDQSSVVPTVASVDEQMCNPQQQQQQQQQQILTYQKKIEYLEGQITSLETQMESLNHELHKLRQQQAQQQQQHPSADCGCILS
jgi:hypothetical protein